jgi:hypothetical protein
MKSDSERQTAYQKRRAERQTRVTVWIGKDMADMCEKLRGEESRNDWLNRAVSELVYRQLTGKKFGQLYSDEDHKRGVARARELGIALPK